LVFCSVSEEVEHKKGALYPPRRGFFLFCFRGVFFAGCFWGPFSGGEKKKNPVGFGFTQLIEHPPPPPHRETPTTPTPWGGGGGGGCPGGWAVKKKGGGARGRGPTEFRCGLFPILWPGGRAGKNKKNPAGAVGGAENQGGGGKASPRGAGRAFIFFRKGGRKKNTSKPKGGCNQRGRLAPSLAKKKKLGRAFGGTEAGGGGAAAGRFNGFGARGQGPGPKKRIQARSKPNSFWFCPPGRNRGRRLVVCGGTLPKGASSVLHPGGGVGKAVVLMGPPWGRVPAPPRGRKRGGAPGFFWQAFRGPPKPFWVFLGGPLRHPPPPRGARVSVV